MPGRGVTTVALLSVGAALCACIPVPIRGDPDPRRHDNIGVHSGDSFSPGVSTREDVVMSLGEPYNVANDGSWVQYTDVRNFGHWALVVGAPYQAGVLYETPDKTRFRTFTVFFDASGRVREVLNVESQAPLLPEARLLDERAKNAAEPGEAIIWQFSGAAWRDHERWTDGAVVVTDRAVLFFESPNTGPLYRLKLRLPVAAIAEVVLRPDGIVEGSDRFALVQRLDGTTEAFAFKLLRGDSMPEALSFDQTRAEHFIDVTGRARRQAGRQLPR
jgi:hypothetical protein